MDKQEKIKKQIESMLFITAKPVSAKQLADALDCKENEVEKACDELLAEYDNGERGVRIIKEGTAKSAKFQMVSSPENTDIVRRLIKDETTGELSQPSLEALTIISYRGPISKLELDKIRGVNCSLILRNLLMRGLIEAEEDKNKGEVFYCVTTDFIKFLGVSSVKELPDYEALNKREELDELLNEENLAN